jgi:hypothetical protein
MLATPDSVRDADAGGAARSGGGGIGCIGRTGATATSIAASAGDAAIALPLPLPLPGATVSSRARDGSRQLASASTSVRHRDLAMGAIVAQFSQGLQGPTYVPVTFIRPRTPLIPPPSVTVFSTLI